jgi:hypothetical protein
MLKSTNLSGACNLFTTTRITEPLRFGLPLAESPRAPMRQCSEFLPLANGTLWPNLEVECVESESESGRIE